MRIEADRLGRRRAWPPASDAEPGCSSDAGLGRVWVLVVVLAILYGSWIPFDFLPARVLGWSLARLTFAHTTFEDVVTNLVVYMPLGIAVARMGGAWGRRVAWAVMIGLVVSLLAESIQTLIPIRVASWVDLTLNVAGAGLGAFVGPVVCRWVARGAGRVRVSLSDRPLLTAAALLSLVWVLLSLAPFDFVRTTSALQSRFLETRWSVWPDRAFRSPWALLHHVARVGPMMLIAGCMTLARRRQGWRASEAWMAGVKHCGVIVGTVEVLRLFVVSRTAFDLSDVTLGVFLAALGSTVAVLVAGRCVLDGRRLPGCVYRGLTTALLVFALLQTVAVLQPVPVRAKVVADAVSADDVPIMTTLLVDDRGARVGVGGSAAEGGGARGKDIASPGATAAVPVAQTLIPADVRWQWPFEAFWHRSMMKAAGLASDQLMRFGMLALAILLITRRRVGRAGMALAAICTVVPVTVVEWSHDIQAGWPLDPTGPLMALVAALVAARVYVLFDPAARAPAVAATADAR